MEERDQDFSIKATVGVVVTIVTVLLAIGYQARTSTEATVRTAQETVDKRFDDLSDQHTRTFEAVIALYGDLDDRVDRIENHLFIDEK